MAWLAVDKDGSEWITTDKPYRFDDVWYEDYEQVKLSKGSIQKLIGRSLTWEDEPVELE